MLDSRTKKKALTVLQEFPMVFNTLCAAYERAQVLFFRNQTWTFGQLRLQAEECTDVTRNRDNRFELTVPMTKEDGTQCHEFSSILHDNEMMLPLPLQHPLGYQNDFYADDPFMGNQLSVVAETMALVAEIRQGIEEYNWIVFPCAVKISVDGRDDFCEVAVTAFHRGGSYVEFILSRRGPVFSFRVSPRKMENGSETMSVTFSEDGRDIFREDVIIALRWCQAYGFEKAFVDGWSTMKA